jgi:hypothetical protein
MNTRTQGQVLLIGLMLIALVTTIVGTGALRSMSSTQTTKQKEEANKASNIAKGALEAGINDETINSSNFTDVNPNAYSQSQAPKTPTDKFVYKEAIPKDHQYLFYMSGYTPADNKFETDYFTGDLSIYYANTGTTCPLLEVIQIDANDKIVDRTYTESTPGCPGTNNFNYTGPGLATPAAGRTLTWDGDDTTFNHSITLTIPESRTVKLLVIRPFFESTKLGFSTGAGLLKPQGREISSTVRTIDGAQKTEKVYQAYPQIPLSLFATVL